MEIPIDIPPGLNSDDTTFASSPAWADASHVRWVEAKAQSAGGWESVTLSTLSGVCRSVLSWTDNSNVQNLAFGQHSKLSVWVGGALYDITPSSGFTPGAVDGAGSAGYGTGSYGGGTYGSPSATDYFPLTWSLAAWGQKLLGCPRNQTIFEWSNNTAVVAAAVSNAPAKVTYMLVSPTRQVFALGCSQESGGVFNPLTIRHSSIGDETAWTTDLATASTAREYTLPGGGRIVAGRVIGRYLLIWTNHGLWLGTYYGQIGKVWSFDKVAGDKCGLIGPNAVAVLGGAAYWISPDRQFHVYALGDVVRTLPCSIRKDFADNLAASQSDKIAASTTSEFNEVRWDYPDGRDGYENSRYLALCVDGPDAGAWTRGKTYLGVSPAGTARVDAGPSQYPCRVTFGGNIYWDEKGESADGGALTAYCETADMYLDPARQMLVRKWWPDFSRDQVGAVSLTGITRPFPQGPETSFGPVMAAPDQEEVDILAVGRVARLLFSATSAPMFFRLGRQVFDAVPRGRR